MPPKPCLGPDDRGCPHNRLTRSGSRCPDCERERTRRRKAAGATGHVGRHMPEQLRRNVLVEQQRRCGHCRIREDELKLRAPRLSLEVHHRDGNPANNHRSNLIALCPDCHREAEAFKRAG